MVDPKRKPSMAGAFFENEASRTLPGALTVLTHRIEQGMSVHVDTVWLDQFHRIEQNESFQEALRSAKRAGDEKEFQSQLQRLGDFYSDGLEIPRRTIQLERIDNLHPVPQRPDSIPYAAYGDYPPLQTMPLDHLPTGSSSNQISLFIHREAEESWRGMLRTLAVVDLQNEQAGQPSGYLGTIGKGSELRRATLNRMPAKELFQEGWPPGKIHAVILGYASEAEAFVAEGAGFPAERFKNSWAMTEASLPGSDHHFINGANILFGPSFSFAFLFMDYVEWRRVRHNPHVPELAKNLYNGALIFSTASTLVEVGDVAYNGLGIFPTIKPITSLQASHHGVLLGKTAVALGGVSGLLMFGGQVAELSQESFVTDQEWVATIAGGATTGGAIGVMLIPMNIAPGIGTVLYLTCLAGGVASAYLQHKFTYERQLATHAYGENRRLLAKLFTASPKQKQALEKMLGNLLHQLNGREAESFLDQVILYEGTHGLRRLPDFVKRTLLTKLEAIFWPSDNNRKYAGLLHLNNALKGKPENVALHLKKTLENLPDDTNAELVEQIAREDPTLPRTWDIGIRLGLREYIGNHADRQIWNRLL